MEQLLKIFFLPFRAIATILALFFQREFFRRTEGAKLAGKRDYGDRLNARCWRRSNIDHLYRLNFDQGLLPAV